MSRPERLVGNGKTPKVLPRVLAGVLARTLWSTTLWSTLILESTPASILGSTFRASPLPTSLPGQDVPHNVGNHFVGRFSFYHDFLRIHMCYRPTFVLSEMDVRLQIHRCAAREKQPPLQRQIPGNLGRNFLTTDTDSCLNWIVFHSFHYRYRLQPLNKLIL